MNIKHVLATAALTIASACVNATLISSGTPTFSGETYGSFGTNPGNASSNDAGYYIWSENSGHDWSVRWTGNDNGNTSWYNWFGSIMLSNAETGSLETIQFESNDQAVLMTNLGFTPIDLVSFEGHAGPGWDGFNFSVTNPSTYTVMDFALGSDMFDDLDVGTEVQSGQNIFIGDNFATPNVQVQYYNAYNPLDTRKVQRFQLAEVPEPGTLALLGLGLAGLGLARRKQQA